jgi:hypothetical protein
MRLVDRHDHKPQRSGALDPHIRLAVIADDLGADERHVILERQLLLASWASREYRCHVVPPRLVINHEK